MNKYFLNKVKKQISSISWKKISEGFFQLRKKLSESFSRLRKNFPENFSQFRKKLSQKLANLSVKM
jgi:hypothetical protein